MNSQGRKSGGDRWRKVSPAERLLGHVIHDEATGCWNYKGTVNGSGYGSAHINGTRQTWHRACWIAFVGEIPDGLELDHLCKNRRCGNPAHLELVTRRENLLRGDGWAGRNARKTHCPKGHEYTEANTSWYRGQRKCRKCHAARERARKQRIYGHLEVADTRKYLPLLEVEG